MTPATEAHLSQLELDALTLDALSREESARVRGHLIGCDQCRRQEAALHEMHHAFRQHVLPKGPPHRKRFSPLFWIGVPVLAAVAAVWIWVVRVHDQPDTAFPLYAAKGGATFRVFLKTAEGARPLENGAHVSPGDNIGFVVTASRPSHLLVVALDSIGKVSVYFPYGGLGSVELPQSKGPITLPQSIALDQTLGAERLWALFSKEPIDVTAVEQFVAAKKVDPRTPIQLNVSADDQVTFLLHKVPRP